MAVRKIDLMHAKFGKTPYKTCEDCCYFRLHIYNRVYFKCEVYGDSSSEATDWRKGYPACGLYNKPTNVRNIVRLVKPERNKENDDMQMSLL